MAGLFHCYRLITGSLKDSNKLVHVHYKQRASHNHVRDLQHCKKVRSFCAGQHLVVRTCAVRALYQLHLGITPLASAAVGDYSPCAAQARPHKLQSLINLLSCLNQGRLSVCLSVWKVSERVRIHASGPSHLDSSCFQRLPSSLRI